MAIPSEQVSAHAHDGEVHLIINAYIYGFPRTLLLPMPADLALAVADQLVSAAVDLEPAAAAPLDRIKAGIAARSQVRVRLAEPLGLWYWQCPVHDDLTDIGLFHDQPSALASAHQHIADRH